MKPLLFCVLTLAIAGCSTAPQKVVTEVKTVEIRVPVRVACLTAEEVPARPARVMQPNADVRGLAAGAVAELRGWEVYYAKADAIMRSCTQ
jgi:hypothetical protein